ncbi:MAG: DUF2314 domain-containing protein [Tepidisphaeraceae bacterium]|jgi:uncharacterized protein YegJ (DUF2314 family)
MAAPKKELISIALLLRKARSLDLQQAQRACDDAFRGAPAPPKVIQMKNHPGFGVILGPMRFAILNVDKPYFSDVAAAADHESNFPARMAIQEHTAWLSVDLVGEPPPVEREKIYGIIGTLIAEFLGDDVLGLIRLPNGPVVGYDFSFIPMLRNRNAAQVFRRGAPDRIIKARDKSEELAAAAAEARRRWPEFVAAYESRRPQQGFAIKKAFNGPEGTEHMWVTVECIAGSTIRGWLSNDPGIIKSLKSGDTVELSAAEIEDWIYTNGKDNVGGFQVKVLKGEPGE